MNLQRLYRRINGKPLKVYWWRYDYPNQLNFGDELTPLLIERLFGLKTTWSEPKGCELAGAGSIIELLQQEANGNNVAVWGSGFIKPGAKNSISSLKFSAVRGKLSLERIDNKNAALGDPGLLIPLAIKPAPQKKYVLGVVPHYVDQTAPELDALKTRKGVKVINVLDSVEKVAKDISSCQLILSSSLHGLIISDAYSVPNYWVPFSDKLTGGDYKFRDYYSVYDELPKPLSLQSLKTLDEEKLISSYTAKKDIQKIQKNLIKAFPY